MPDPTFNPARQQWGHYPFVVKPTTGPSATPSRHVEYAQGALNTLGALPPLRIDGQYGPKTAAAVTSYRQAHQLGAGILDQATWDLVDDEAFNLWTPAKKRLRVPRPNGPAINSQGVNRHTGQPVNDYGLTRDTDRLRCALLVAFPGSPSKHNYAVDRMMRGSTTLSDHARGEALDFMLAGFDGEKRNITAKDRAYGRDMLEWLASRCYGPLKVGLRGKTYRGPWRISYALCDGWTFYASEGATIRRLKASSNQHADHLHCSIVPSDRR
jgi:hypothetical protein